MEESAVKNVDNFFELDDSVNKTIEKKSFSDYDIFLDIKSLNSDSKIEDVLREYVEIQKKEAKIREDKKFLQNLLDNYFIKNGIDKKQEVIQLNNKSVRINRNITEEFQYNEDLIKERLGSKYVLILKPDLNKIKQNIDKLESVLEPVISFVGSPNKELIISAVEKRLISKEVFKDAYKKIKKTKIAVTVIDPEKVKLS